MNGYMEKVQRIKESATPIDNVNKFAWYDDDYETVEVWHEYTAEELARIAEAEAEAEKQERLNALLDMVSTKIEKSDKKGFNWKCTYIGEICVMKEYVETEQEETTGGDYLNPIHYSVGDEVEAGLWYYESDPELPFECIKSGKPFNFHDTEYFDVIE